MDNRIEEGEAIHARIDAIMAHGDPSMREMLRDLIFEFHNQVMSDPKSRSDMKAKMKALGDNIVKLPLVFTPEKRESGGKINLRPVYLICSVIAVLLAVLWFGMNVKPSGAPVRVCNIKGNINAAGEKIYHLPNTMWYEKTFIDESKGEQWFCSENEARGAGWRAAH